ncbi:MAG: carboxymuconolactone decarboxylase family protein [Phycisphaerae bacterium]|nr:carboxymuconolactone decarboxylase family protein [Phycisphaerae bacterium]NUQ45126.1 carboxymuconolactone decarboxylase family protein [Phycisphaerae bacterium]
MPWIRTIPDDEAAGPLKAQYDAAYRRAGRVYNIVRVMSLNPAAMDASMALYRALMFGPSPLSRAQREMLAVVVSVVNQCVY